MNTTDHRTGTPGSAPDRLAFDRSDRVGLAVTMWAIGVGGIAAYVIWPLWRWARDEALHIPFFSPVVVPALDAVGQPHGLGSYDLVLAHPSTGQRLLALVPGILTAGVVAAACVLVLAIMRPIGAGDPFAPGHVRRLRTLAFVLIIGPLVAMFAQIAGDGAIVGQLDLGGLAPGVSLSIPWLPLVVGLCIGLVAEGFKVGARLRDDVDGLI